ncbi:hypothetical protein HPB51_021166 [Rhipicephalus microplus]|uniref:Uncharacterized protein n=1 Tax=Rhipicephalus microplus TaxID=6941 RepID=A0A9J6F5K9_RHIMP|nr:hypothetical protein HPB51_021166 [Rhipicephalus microplus]
MRIAYSIAEPVFFSPSRRRPKRKTARISEDAHCRYSLAPKAPGGGTSPSCVTVITISLLTPPLVEQSTLHFQYHTCEENPEGRGAEHLRRFLGAVVCYGVARSAADDRRAFALCVQASFAIRSRKAARFYITSRPEKKAVAALRQSEAREIWPRLADDLRVFVRRWRAPALRSHGGGGNGWAAAAARIFGGRRRLSLISSAAQWRVDNGSVDDDASSVYGDSTVDLSSDARALLGAMVTSTYKLQHESIALEMKSREEIAGKEQKQTTGTTSGSSGRKQTTKKRKAPKIGK